jgi:hypothetical protein
MAVANFLKAYECSSARAAEIRKDHLIFSKLLRFTDELSCYMMRHECGLETGVIIYLMINESDPNSSYPRYVLDPSLMLEQLEMRYMSASRTLFTASRDETTRKR